MQLRALGVARPAGANPMVRTRVTAAAEAFFASDPLVVLGAADGAGRMWATLPLGARLRAAGAATVALEATLAPGDPLAAVARARFAAGLLAIDLRLRGRIRLNGTATPAAGGWSVEVEQLFSNCPKHIARRAAPAVRAPSRVRGGTRLWPEAAALLARCETWFLASAAPGFGADASHRGGPPGTIAVLAPDRVAWPDFEGNGMFLTLGNLALAPALGLLALDAGSGDALALSGTATVAWGTGGARTVELRIERARLTRP